jgi:nicotinamidase-related amidase
MSRPPRDAHDNAPDACPLVVLLVDVINDFDFPEADTLLQSAVPAARNIAALTRQARRLRIPVIYANDNFGRWRSDLPAVLRHALGAGGQARTIARALRPRRSDYLVLKPKHSAFFGSPLELLLRYLRAERVILTGFAGNICVLFTANDLHMRDYRLWVPADCCASNTDADNAFALAQMKDVLNADIRPSPLLDLRKLKR